MSLSRYKSKRRFNETPEPEGKISRSGQRLEFVVQKHHATRLHYDFRLELDGVLKSWAVPKGPSMDPKVRRLAMMVEDHPFEYRTFEGTIPEGNYGAGNVIIWDRGTYEHDQEYDDKSKSLQEGLKKGELKFILHGEKLKGSFALIKTPRMGDKAWLMIKHRDEYASEKDITEQDKSVVSGRGVDDEPGTVSLNDYPKAPIPRGVKPMLATLTDKPFDDPKWLYEIKWDGYRAIGSWDGKKPELYSRNGLDFSQRYSPVTEALRQLKHKAVLDGEIVALDEDGRSRFAFLQNYQRQSDVELVYYVFDILWLDGHDLRQAPLQYRKAVLEQILPKNSAVRYSSHVKGRGKDFFKAAQRQHLEGIIAKDGLSSYHSTRSEQWLKIKTHLRQEVVIGGFTEPKGSRKYIGALIVGVYEDDRLVYTGHAGGLPIRQLKEIRNQLEKIERPDSPFAGKIRPNAPVHWVEPQLICEVSFAEWTNDGLMRQPIFDGIRADKKPKEVKREMPKISKTDKGTTKSKRHFEFSHLDKVFFPEAGYTKGDLVDYYRSVMPFILPYVKDRPHNLLRQPNGYKGKSFFQKDVGGVVPAWVKTALIYSESNAKNISYYVCNSPDSLLYEVQLGCIEINPWNSAVKKLAKPDWIVIDLDPEAISFKKVIEVALEVKKVTDELKIPTFPKTSGKTGIHIYIPTKAAYDYKQARQFGELLANIVNQKLPKITSVTRDPKERQKRVYLDYLQNREGQTLAAPYSVRPTKEASVSTPLHWDEVNDKLDPANFTIKNIFKRLDKEGDLWKPVLKQKVDIKDVLSKIS